MKLEDWESSDSAQSMLETLHREQSEFLTTQIPQLHKYFIACCWKNQHLIPQEDLRNGLRGAEKWAAGEISDDELNKLNWYAEAEAFAIDYAKTPDEIATLKSLIDKIIELREMRFEEARSLLRDAAYFAEMTMIYPRMNKVWIKSIFRSQLLCPDLLRKFIEPVFSDR